MPGLLKEVKSVFGTDNLYEVLDIPTTASKAEGPEIFRYQEKQISKTSPQLPLGIQHLKTCQPKYDCYLPKVKKAYYKLSLTVHPDRVEKNKAQATKKFQALGKVYSILSDEEKRACYDESGMVDDDDFAADTDRNWEDYWRLLFPKLDHNDISQFEEKYKGSEDELEDIKLAYTKYKGDMGKILDSVMCSTTEDEPRFRSIISRLIESGELPALEAFINEPREKQATRKRKAEKEAREAKKVMQDMNGKAGEDSLQAMILRNQKSRQEQADDFIKQMESKYAGSSASSGKTSKKKSK